MINFLKSIEEFQWQFASIGLILIYLCWSQEEMFGARFNTCAIAFFLIFVEAASTAFCYLVIYLLNLKISSKKRWR
ncbi:hypothetical protein QPK87_25265 [Kamptonema cortianum]|nr:hypothetical protein [Kamptonema cortianum]